MLLVEGFLPVCGFGSRFFLRSPKNLFFGLLFLLPNTISRYTSYMSSNKNMAHNRHTVRRAAALERIAQIGPFLEGSLCSFNRPGCSRPGWHLTFKQRGQAPARSTCRWNWSRQYKKWTLNSANVSNNSSAKTPPLPGAHSQPCRKPAGRKPLQGIDESLSAQALSRTVIRACLARVSTAGSTLCPTRAGR